MGKVQTALAKVQSALNVPKSNYNSFGKYHYRSAENIVEAAKPLCNKEGLILTLSDEIVLVSNRVYVKSMAAVVDVDSGEKIEVSAYAREPDAKKGMDDSQITGTASSYARKYALNGLFAIDDAKDPDTDEYTTVTRDSTVKCFCCGREITDRGSMTAKTIIDRSKSKFGKIMCYDCSVAQANGGNINVQ